MHSLKRTLMSFGVAAMVFSSSQARAESALPDQFSTIFEIIESFILQGGLIPSSIGGGGCRPAIKLGFPSITMQFGASSATCPVVGDIKFSLIPFGAQVRLEVRNNPMLQSINMDIAMKLGRKNSPFTFQWQVLNGHVAFRMQPNAGLNEWAITGMGQRVRTNAGLDVSRRLNIFDKTTGNGYALMTTVSNPKGGKRVVTRKLCGLAGAQATDQNSGTLACN